MNPEIYQKPPVSFNFEYETKGIDNVFGATFEDARTAAFAAAEAQDWVAHAITDVVASTKETWSVVLGKSVGCLICRYRPQAYAATCYFWIQWDEVIYDQSITPSGDPIEISRETKEWTMSVTPVDGVCLPSDFDVTDTTTWPSDTDWAEVGPLVPDVDPGLGEVYWRFAQLENVLFSYVTGYVPPDDGSANGFPA